MSNKYNVGQTVYVVEAGTTATYLYDEFKICHAIYRKRITIRKTQFVIEEIEIEAGIVTYNNKYQEPFVFPNEEEAEEFIKNVKIERE